jgi:hypothetical protein
MVSDTLRELAPKRYLAILHLEPLKAMHESMMPFAACWKRVKSLKAS